MGEEDELERDKGEEGGKGRRGEVAIFQLPINLVEPFHPEVLAKLQFSYLQCHNFMGLAGPGLSSTLQPTQIAPLSFIGLIS